MVLSISIAVAAARMVSAVRSANVKVLAQLDRRLAARHAALDHAARQLGGRTRSGCPRPELRQKRHDRVVHGRFHPVR